MSTLTNYPATGGITAVASVGSSPAAEGAAISGSTLTLQPADGTHPGVVTTGAQTIAGAKTFSGAISASNLSGTNTGDVTLAAVGSAPAAEGASLSGQALTLQPADATHPGVVTTGTQTIAGAKTFANDLAWTTGVVTGAGSTTGFTFNANNSPTYTFAFQRNGSTQVYFSGGVLTVSGGVQATSLTVNSGPTITTGAGSPEGAVTAPVGSLYLRTDGGVGTALWVKESGSGNTGWASK